MKIGIITLHRARNYGSVLQTLALQEKIKDKGVDVEILDYYPDRYHNVGLLKRLKGKSKRFEKNFVALFACRCIIFISYIKKMVVFDDFLKRNLKLTSKSYRTYEEFEKDVPKADIYCTGSDQVWNSYWNEGIDYSLFLKFVPKDKFKFSYAASFGKSELEDDEKEETKELLEAYDYISVRENAGVKILEDLGFKNCPQVLDPTLLLVDNEWDKYVDDKYKNKKYILTYNLHHDKKIDIYAKELSKKYNLPVYNISYNWHDIYRSGHLVWCPTVENYLGLIKYAQYVVTDSFHATVFSIIFRKQFISIYPELASSRISSLLELVNLQERGISSFDNVNLADKGIDYDKVHTLLSIERGKSDKYINDVLNSYKER